MEEFTLEDYNRFIKDFEQRSTVEFKERKRRIKKSEDAEKKRKADILKLRHVYEKCDALIGLYPMTKEKLLEQIELMHNGTMLMNDYGIMFGSAKSWNRLAISSDYFEFTPDKLYDYYLTEVKPWIFNNEQRKD